MKTMKKLAVLLLLLPILAGCTKSEISRSKEFAHSGCAGDAATRAWGNDSDASLLTLKYEDGDLRVTRTNATMNCAIKDGGIICDATVDGNVIRYRVYEKDGPMANCICRVEEMSSLVTGLEVGKKYTFEYSCGFGYNYPSFTFVFKKGLRLIQNTSTM